MILSRWSRCRRWAALASLAILSVLGAIVPDAAHAGPIFAMADSSTIVVRGTVERVTRYEKAKLTVFRIQVTRVIKGDVAVGETIDLAQEMLFATTQPYFISGTETLIFAVPLPSYSSFKEALPDGRYWRWTERLEGAADVAVLTDPALTEAVGRYVAVRDDAEALADFLAQALAGPSTRIRQDAISAIGAQREIQALLDAPRLQPLAPWLRDERVPRPERGNVLVQLARIGAPGVVELAEALAVTGGSLQAAAVDALVTIGKPPPEERLLAWSASPDEALRVAASRGLAKGGSSAAIDRVAAILESDGSRAVRLAVVHALGRTQAPRVVTLLAGELAKSDKEITLAAADSLVKQGSDEAIAELTKALETGTENAQLASAFALKRINRHETDEILERIEQSHPDPNVRRLCKLALGESMHEH